MVVITLERVPSPSTARPERAAVAMEALRRLGTHRPRDIVDVAAVGALVGALSLALLALFATASGAGASALTIAATAALLAVVLPIYRRHIVFAMRDAIPPGSSVTSAVLAVLVIGATPVLGAAWLNALHIVAVVVALTLRPILAAPITLVLVAATAPCAVLLGASEQDALWLAVTTGMRVIAVYTLVWMVVALRRLRSAGAELAEQAIARERLRIDRELARTVQSALVEIAVFAGRAGDFTALGDRTSARAELAELVDVSRRGLADARLLIRGFQQPALHREIASASALLAAAGIEARVQVPVTGLPEHPPESLRADLRAVLARLLRDGAAGPLVITVHRVGGDWVLECVTDPVASTSGDAA